MADAAEPAKVCSWRFPDFLCDGHLGLEAEVRNFRCQEG